MHLMDNLLTFLHYEIVYRAITPPKGKGTDRMDFDLFGGHNGPGWTLIGTHTSN